MQDSFVNLPCDHRNPDTGFTCVWGPSRHDLRNISWTTFYVLAHSMEGSLRQAGAADLLLRKRAWQVNALKCLAGIYECLRALWSTKTWVVHRAQPVESCAHAAEATQWDQSLCILRQSKVLFCVNPGASVKA